jgi:hypothetical protein
MLIMTLATFWQYGSDVEKIIFVRYEPWNSPDGLTVSVKSGFIIRTIP